MRNILYCLGLLILVACGSGEKASSTVTPAVTLQPNDFDISSNAITLDRWEDSAQLSVSNVKDTNNSSLSNVTITYTSDNEQVVKVNNEGLLISNLQGEAKITVKVANSAGSASKDIPVTVAIQQNSACKLSSPSSPGPVAEAKTYTEVSSNTTTKGANRSYALDLNGDNKDDMFWISTFFDMNTLEQTSTSSIWLSQGDGTFIDATTTYLPEGLVTADVPRQTFSADIDGDDDKDFIVLQHGYDPGGLQGLDCNNVECPGAPNLVITMGDDGKLRDTASIALSPYDTNGFTHAGGVADVECDGDVDILEGQLGNELAFAPNRLQINDGTGKFTADDNAFPANFTSMGGFYGGAFCDLDGDGDPDVYMAQNGAFNGADSADVIFTNDGFGNFRLLSGKRFDESRLGEDNQLPADTRCFDFDGDGLNDLLKPNETVDLQISFELLRNNGNMTFTDVTASMLQNLPPDRGAYSPIILDLNDDNWPDILAQGTGDYLRIYWNNGAGFTEYQFPASTAISTRGTNVTHGDFDADGDIDIHISRSEYESFLLKAN